jgi:glycine cleavage system H protein
MLIPENLRYTKEHEWIRMANDVGTVGVTDFAQHELGDVVFVELPVVGTAVTSGQAFGVVESVKAVSDVYAPIDGIVTRVNDALNTQPELVNQDPYGAGWLIEIRATDAAAVAALMDAAAYGEQTRDKNA